MYPNPYPPRQPFIVGPTVDKILGFLAGFVAQILGVIGTIVVMYVWAGSDPTPDTQERREHAKSVSIWSGVGCLLPFLFLLFSLVVFAALATSGSQVLDGPPVLPLETFPAP